jgi:hypothetical protein
MPERNIFRERERGKEKLRAVLEQSGAAGFQGAVERLDAGTLSRGGLERALARYRLAQECGEYYTPPAGAGQLRHEAGRGGLFLIRSVYRAEKAANRLLSRAADRLREITRAREREIPFKASPEAFFL